MSSVWCWVMDSQQQSSCQAKSFQAELAKWLFCLHRSIASNIACMALHWPSMRACILNKVNSLLKIITGDLSLSAQSFYSIPASEFESILWVWQCRFLELTLDSNFTTSILTSHNSVSFSSVKKGHSPARLHSTTQWWYPFQFFVHKIASSQKVSFGTWL